MGPRAKRRLRGGLIALALVAAVIVAVTLFTRRSGSHSSQGLRADGQVVGQTDSRYFVNSPKLVYGMTERQVLRLVGPPTKKLGRCWQYELNLEYKKLGKQIWNADRVCFDGGLYSESHGEWNGKWDYQQTSS